MPWGYRMGPLIGYPLGPWDVPTGNITHSLSHGNLMVNPTESWTSHGTIHRTSDGMSHGTNDTPWVILWDMPRNIAWDVRNSIDNPIDGMGRPMRCAVG